MNYILGGLMVKEARQRNILMFGIFRSGISQSKILQHGFSLIEIMVALLIVAIMGAIFIPRFAARGARPLDLVTERIITLTQAGYDRAIMTGKLHRVLFSLKEPAFIEL